MDVHEIRRRLAEKTKARKRREVASATGLPYSYLRQVEEGLIENPGSKQMDTLRDYFLAQDILARVGQYGSVGQALSERR